MQILFLTVLDQLDLIAFGCVNEGNSTAVRRMWSVGQWMAFCRSVFGEFVQVVDLKSQVRKVRTDNNRAAPVEFAYLNFLIAAWCFQKDEVRAAPGSVAANLLKAENVLVERNRLLQVVYAIARVQ